MTGVLIRRNVDTDTHRGYHVKTQTQRNMSSDDRRRLEHRSCKPRDTKDWWPPQKLGRGKDHILPRLSEEVWPCWYLQSRLLASGPVRQSSIVLSRPVRCTFCGRPRKWTQWEKSSKSSPKPSPFCPIRGERGLPSVCLARDKSSDTAQGHFLLTPRGISITLPWAWSPHLEWHQRRGARHFKGELAGRENPSIF